MSALPVAEAAAALAVSVPTLKRWIRAGAPVARRGRRGRGCRALIDPDAVQAWLAAVERDDTGRAQLIVELQAAVPELVADAALHALGEASPHAQGGAELRRLRIAIAATARLASDAVLRHLAEKSNACG